MMVTKNCNKVALKTLRKRLKLSQSQFAQALGLSRRSTISDWENGKVIPDWISRAKVLDRLLKEAGMDWDDLPDEINDDGAVTKKPLR
jgi:transcriptional regulator with XRE-family HTH domain